MKLISSDAKVQEGIMLGQFINAYENRLHADENYDKQSAYLKECEKDVKNFGMFEDCGPSYDYSLTHAQASHSEALKRKQSQEKHFKKIKHELLEMYPQYASSLDNLMEQVRQQRVVDQAVKKPKMK